MTGDKPKFKGNVDVAIWINKTKEGKDYAVVNIGGFKVNCWINEPKKE